MCSETNAYVFSLQIQMFQPPVRVLHRKLN